jgi:hypothetical protein
MNDVRVNYTRTLSGNSAGTASIGGSTPLTGSTPGLFPSGYSPDNALFQITFSPVTPTGSASVTEAVGSSNRTRQLQWNIVDGYAYTYRAHQFKFGLDWRRLHPQVASSSLSQVLTVTTAASWNAGNATSISYSTVKPQDWIFTNWSFYAQDAWKVLPRVTITYGLRWDINPAPGTSNGTPGLALNMPVAPAAPLPSGLALAPFGSPLYSTAWRNLAPRIGVAYQLSTAAGWERVIRGGFGIFYDTAAFAAGAATGTSGVYAASTATSGPWPAPFTVPALPPTPPVPAPSAGVCPASTFAAPSGSCGYKYASSVTPDLKSPHVFQYNVTIEQSLGHQQAVSASFVAATGRNLLTFGNYINAAPFVATAVSSVSPSGIFNLTANGGTSDYNALQVQYTRRLSHGLQALVNYTWSHSIDNASTAALGGAQNGIYGVLNNGSANYLVSPLQRASSDYDSRHRFGAAVSYSFPTPRRGIIAAILGHWGTDAIYHFNSATPFDQIISTATYNSLTQTRRALVLRPNLVPNVPLWLHGGDCSQTYAAALRSFFHTPTGAATPGCPGGKGINPAAINVNGIINPTTGALLPGATTGTLPRNALRGFPMNEFDLTLRRDFPLRGERLHLEFRADFFNVINHPSFGMEKGSTGNVPLPASLGQSGNIYGFSSSSYSQAQGFGSGGFGGLSSAFNIGSPRVIQLSAKLRF